MAYSDEVLADTPLLYARLGGTTSAQALVDASGNGRNGSAWQGTPVYGQPSLLPNTADFSTQFTASGRLDWLNAAWMDHASATFEAWVKPLAIGANQPIIDRDQNSIRVFQFHIMPSGKFEFIFWTVASGATPIFVTGTTTTAVANGVYHFVATYNSSTGVATIYINGVLERTISTTASPLAVKTCYLRVGVTYGGGISPNTYFNGYIDEVAVYGTALSAARVLAHYDAGITPAVSTAVLSVDAFESVVATSGVATRQMDSFEAVVATSGAATRQLDVFEVLVASSVTLSTPTNDLWVWNGTTEVPANVTVWNGTSEVAASVSVT